MSTPRRHVAALTACLALPASAPISCAPDRPSASTESASASAGATASSGASTPTGATTSAVTTGDAGTGSATGSATGESASTSSGGASESTGSSGTTAGVVFDVGFETSTSGGPCEQGGGEIEFSYIWIANSPQGTVSKIDTQTLEEVGRYQVRPQGGGEPSRTSVNLAGDVVIASRTGGVTKIFARASDCVEQNGSPGIQTSTGKDDVLPWGQEECVAWYTDYTFTSERAVAWTSGQLNQGTCAYEDAKVWVGGTHDSVNIEILRLDGDTGVEEQKVIIADTKGYMTRSPYGGAVDLDNDFWAVNGYCDATLVEVRHEDFSYELHNLPQELCAYGITVDSTGYVWIGGYQGVTGRYDPEAHNWEFVQAQGLGIQEDADGRLWLGAYGQNGVYAIDGQTLEVLSYTPLPTSGQSKGVSIDFYGYVWVVSDGGDTAIRMHPETLQYDIYDGLDEPYSYSDMTGWGLKNVAAPNG